MGHTTDITAEAKVCLTFNLQLILKLWNAGKTYNGAFQGIFRGNQKGRDPLKKSQEMPRYILWPRQKNKLKHFKN
jgi:hypothetical protein